MPEETVNNTPLVQDLDDRVSRFEYSVNDTPLRQLPPVEADVRIPSPSNLQLIAAVSNNGSMAIQMRWTHPGDPTIDHFEVWVSRAVGSAESFTKVAESVDSPASFSLPAESNTNVVFCLRTVMRNGLISAINASPTITAQVVDQVDTPTLKIGGVAGISVVQTIVTSVTPTTLGLQYKDWAGNNQTQTVVIGIAVNSVNRTFTSGVMTA